MSNNKLTLMEKSQIVTLAATSKLTHAQIAGQFGVSARRVGQLVQEHMGTVTQAQHDNMMLAIEGATGSSVASKTWRMKQYERDLVKLDHHHTPDAVNARTKILGQVAKELGDIAPVQHNIRAEVSHIIGIDMQRALGSSAQVVSSEVLEITDGG
jgi:hypothetical protein